MRWSRQREAAEQWSEEAGAALGEGRGRRRGERTQVRRVRRVCPGRLGSLDCPPSLRRQASEGRDGAGGRVTGLGKEGQKSDKGPEGAGGRQTTQLWWKLQDNYSIPSYFINKQMRTMTKPNLTISPLTRNPKYPQKRQNLRALGLRPTFSLKA